MLNPKHQRYADRLRELIDEGKEVANLRRPPDGRFIRDEDTIPIQAWLAKVRNIVATVFGPESSQFYHYQDLVPEGATRHVEEPHEIYRIVGLLTGALDDLEKGYLLGQEFIIAAEVFDSVLEQAKHLLDNGYKDPAAVLARVVLEDALKRLARLEGIDDTQRASRINQELRSKDRYPQPQWRLVDSWLDIGNAAAHGRFNDYDDEKVKNLIENIERFLAVEFRP